jgi:hypothetical protein
MRQTGPKSHSFILRLWLEPREIEGASPNWRGVIEHVQTSESRYFCDLEEISAFVRPFLVEAGGKTAPRRRGTP